MTYITTISSKNQITLPSALLQKLGIKPGNKIIFEEDEGLITARPVSTSIVDELAGSLDKYISPEKLHKSWEEIKEQSEKAYTKYLAKNYTPQK